MPSSQRSKESKRNTRRGPWVCGECAVPGTTADEAVSLLDASPNQLPDLSAALTATICPRGLISADDSGHSKATYGSECRR